MFFLYSLVLWWYLFYHTNLRFHCMFWISVRDLQHLKRIFTWLVVLIRIFAWLAVKIQLFINWMQLQWLPHWLHTFVWVRHTIKFSITTKFDYTDLDGWMPIQSEWKAVGVFTNAIPTLLHVYTHVHMYVHMRQIMCSVVEQTLTGEYWW